MISEAERKRERATLVVAKNWFRGGVIVQVVITLVILGFGVVTPLANPMTVLFMVFMVVMLGLGWLSYNSSLSAVDKNPTDSSYYAGEVTWAELLTTLFIHILVAAFFSWVLADNLQKPFLDACWERSGATEDCTQ